MRIALLSAVKRTETGGLRAGLTIGGRSVIEWQAQLAFSLGCERVICLCETIGDTIQSLQHQVELSGVDFHAIRSNFQLVNLIHTGDELLLLADGMFGDEAFVRSVMMEGDGLHYGIATLPQSHPYAQNHPEEFERIDRDRHWAGLAAFRANFVQNLADLPPESDSFSSLIRLALQARIPCRDAELSANTSADWRLVEGEENARAIEKKRVEGAISSPSWFGPGKAISAWVLKQIAPKGLARGPEFSTLAALGFVVGGVGLAATGFEAPAIGIAALGAMLGTTGALWKDMRARLWGRVKNSRWDHWVSPAIDAATLFTLGLSMPKMESLAVQYGLPVLAIGAVILAARKGRLILLPFWQDRAVILIILAFFAGLDRLSEGLLLFGIGAIADMLFQRDNSSQAQQS